MTSHVTQDIRLLYEAVYDQDLREKADEYNYQVRDEDIVEVATEYFYTYGLNSDGVDILIEKVGLDNFVEFVYDLSEDYVVLDEAKKKYVSHLAKSRQQAKQKAAEAAQERKDDETKPESRGADTEAKEEQPKSKKPVRDAIARNIFRAVDAYKSGMERHRQATQTAGRLAGETARTVGKVVSTTHEAGRRAGEHVKKHGLKSLANEEFEYWVNSLIEEGYDLSEYTWDDMYEYYVMSKQTNEQVDLYDIILSHLLDEGYADTNEDALAIMANMSEEWKEDIIDEAVLGARRGTIRAVIEKGGRSIRYVPSGGDILAGDRAAAERASAADFERSSRNRENADRVEKARKKFIQNLNAKPGEDSGDYDTGYYGDDDTSDGKRHYSLSHTNRDARRRRASGR